jgi:predicted nucleic acid-binding Zn ribbon protein
MAKAIWARVVGPQVASVTQAVAIRGGDVLVVRTKNSIWANELTLLKDDILKRLNRALGGSVLSDIYFGATGLRSDEPAIPSQTVQEETPKPQPDEVQGESLSPRKILEIEEKVKAIRDPQLRSRLRDNLIRMAQADEWKRQNGWKCCEACGTLAYPREDKPGPHLCDVCRVKQMRRR